MKVNKQKLFKLIGIGFLSLVLFFFVLSLVFKKDGSSVSEKENSSSTDELVSSPNLTEEENIVSDDESVVEDEEIPLFVPIETPNTETNETVKNNEDSYGVEFTVDENGVEYVNGVPVLTEENGAYDLRDDLVYSDIFKDAKQLDIGYDLLNYGFELIDASSSYLLFLANPEVLTLYDIHNDKLMQLDIGVTGGSISDDEQFVVFFKSSYEGSQAFYFNLTNPRGPRPINSFDGEIGDIEMVEGSIFMTYNDEYDSHSYSVTSYPMMNSNYEFPTNNNITYNGVGHDIYVNENNEVLVYSTQQNSLVSLKVGETPKKIKDTTDMPYLTPVSDFIYEGGDVYSLLLDSLYINGVKTEYDFTSSITFFKGKLYFGNDVFLHSYDGNKFEQLDTHQYVDKIVGSKDSLYMTTLESLLFKMK